MLTKKSASVRFFNMIGTKRIKYFSLYGYKGLKILRLLDNGRLIKGINAHGFLAKYNIFYCVKWGFERTASFT